MYQDNISAMLGTGEDPREQQLAQALRGQQAGGDFLSLSTIGQASTLGQNINKRTSAAAKQGGQLKQAMQERQAKAAEAQAAREARDAAAKLVADATAGRHADNMKIKQAIEARQVADDANKLILAKEKQKLNKLKFETNTDHKRAELGFDTQRFLSEYELDRDKFAYKKDYDAAKLDQGNMKIANDYELGKGRLNLGEDKLAEMERQFGVRENGIMTRHQSDSILKWAKFDWDKDEFGMVRSDEQKKRMRRAYEFDVKTAENRAMFNERLGFQQGSLDAEMERHADKMENDAAKLAYSLVGKNVSKKKNGMTAGTEKTYTNHAAEATGLLSMYSSYKPEYASEIPFSGQLATGLGTWADPLMDKDTQDLTGWWRTYKKDNILPERHKMFGAVLTPAEIKSWNQASINEGMSDYTIRKNLAWRERFIRDKMSIYAGNALEAGASDNWVLRNYGSLIDGERYIQPPEGDPMNPPENSEVETSTPTVSYTDEQINAMSDEEYNAYLESLGG
jgi:hypothetical protein